MEIAMNADPTATKNPMIRPATVIVGETFAALKYPASGLFMTNASPILANPTLIPTVTDTIPRTRKNTVVASYVARLVKDPADSDLLPKAPRGLNELEPSTVFYGI
jgi:hypothetical protein